jgi:hypothetical protein
LFFYWILELFRQRGIIGFSMGLWNCYKHMTLFVFLLKFDNVPTLWYYLFIYWTLELFRQCSFSCVSMWLWNCSDSVALLILYWTLEMFRQCGIIDFVLDFATVWHHLFIYWTLEMFRQCNIFFSLCEFGIDQRVWHY